MAGEFRNFLDTYWMDNATSKYGNELQDWANKGYLTYDPGNQVNYKGGEDGGGGGSASFTVNDSKLPGLTLPDYIPQQYRDRSYWHAYKEGENVLHPNLIIDDPNYGKITLHQNTKYDKNWLDHLGTIAQIAVPLIIGGAAGGIGAGTLGPLMGGGSFGTWAGNTLGRGAMSTLMNGGKFDPLSIAASGLSQFVPAPIRSFLPFAFSQLRSAHKDMRAPGRINNRNPVSSIMNPPSRGPLPPPRGGFQTPPPGGFDAQPSDMMYRVPPGENVRPVPGAQPYPNANQQSGLQINTTPTTTMRSSATMRPPVEQALNAQRQALPPQRTQPQPIGPVRPLPQNQIMQLAMRPRVRG
jgi:hypothetical protein